MPWFIFEAMIAHYKERLAQETDSKTIKTLRKLLALSWNRMRRRLSSGCACI
jgi:hypothetical protein